MVVVVGVVVAVVVVVVVIVVAVVVVIFVVFGVFTSKKTNEFFSRCSIGYCDFFFHRCCCWPVAVVVGLFLPTLMLLYLQLMFYLKLMLYLQLPSLRPRQVLDEEKNSC